MANHDPKTYYDAESATYSKRRYEGPLATYTQFLFRTRLRLFIDMLYRILPEKASFMEVGSADGIIIDKILKIFPHAVEKYVGIDISEMMLEKARTRIHDPRVSFVMRNEEENETFDVVIELGVHVTDLEEEVSYIKHHLKDNGYFFYSTAGRNSIHARLKLKDAWYVSEYMTYEEIEKILSKHFEIVDSRAYGIFIPKLWAIPSCARLIQPLADALLRFLPSLYHEKLYLVRNRRS